ncbi:MAG: hypothetical protein JWO19_4035 [Bryobacterales bacterium]|nr:hypothetical protein [Bryobacterales bacterium]
MLSLPIGDEIRLRYERGRLRKAIIGELVELRYTMAMVASDMRDATGTQDDAFLQWLEHTIADYKGADQEQLKYLDAIRQLRSQLAGAVLPKRLSNRTTVNLKAYQLPFLNAQIGRLAIFPTDFQQQVLQIKAQLDNFNSDVTYLARQSELTFNPAIGADNRAAIQTNLDAGYAKQGRTAIHIAELIAKVEELAQPSHLRNAKIL